MNKIDNICDPLREFSVPEVNVGMIGCTLPRRENMSETIFHCPEHLSFEDRGSSYFCYYLRIVSTS